MSAPTPIAHRTQLAREVRKRFVADAGRALVELGAAFQERLTALIKEAVPLREMQTRREIWTLYQHSRSVWCDSTLRAWQAALLQPVITLKQEPQTGRFELVGTEEVENKIAASRLAQAVIDKLGDELSDLQLRVRYLEELSDLDANDILRPEVSILVMVQQWALTGMPQEAWPMVNDVALQILTERFKLAYASGNELLIQQGVLPTIELKDRVRRVSSTEQHSPPPSQPDSSPDRQAARGPLPAEPKPRPANAFGGRLGWGRDANKTELGNTGDHATNPDDIGRHSGSVPHTASGQPHRSGYDSTSDETRMLTSGTPLARARSRAMGVMGQLKRLLVGAAGASYDTSAQHLASPALAAALAAHAQPAAYGVGGDTVLEDYSPAGVQRVAGTLRQRTSELKAKAETQGEKATIEIVALMFQAILQEDRIPPGIRVWFARLQMPVLRVALAEPDFFGTLNHPARQLIDRMGSCVMGFDASAIQANALQTEIKRVVQVIEQYPETGKRVFQLVYEEFQKFMTQFLTGNASTQKVVSVAQQVEQKETLTIQYTIEMRNMLKGIPVRDEIREFLFKTWAEVLAVAAVRKGPQHAETLGLKKSASDLVWAASAKPTRTDRARVIQNLPQLLQHLRAGMSLLGVPPSEQERHLKIVSDILADAFLSKTQAIPAEQIQALAARLENLEDFLSDDCMGDLPLDAESIELMLGIDASMIDVVADGGSRPNEAMLAWAQEIQLGSWFTLDHNGRISQVQFVWRSERKHLHLFASTDGRSCLIQAGRLASYLQAGLLLPQEEEALTVRATRDALDKLEANPERLLG